MRGFGSITPHIPTALATRTPRWGSNPFASRRDASPDVRATAVRCVARAPVLMPQRYGHILCHHTPGRSRSHDVQHAPAHARLHAPLTNVLTHPCTCTPTLSSQKEFMIQAGLATQLDMLSGTTTVLQLPSLTGASCSHVAGPSAVQCKLGCGEISRARWLNLLVLVSPAVVAPSLRLPRYSQTATKPEPNSDLSSCSNPNADPDTDPDPR